MSEWCLTINHGEYLGVIAENLFLYYYTIMFDPTATWSRVFLCRQFKVILCFLKEKTYLPQYHQAHSLDILGKFLKDIY